MQLLQKYKFDSCGLLEKDYINLLD